MTVGHLKSFLVCLSCHQIETIESGKSQLRRKSSESPIVLIQNDCSFAHLLISPPLQTVSKKIAGSEQKKETHVA
jgi:hypothetical protein